MYVSKQIRAFMEKAKAIIFPSTYQLPAKAENVKYVIYSAHDWTVSQHLLFLNATNGNFTNLPFSSQVNYELHSTEGCADASCFWVEVFYNTEPQIFLENCKDPVKCTYNEFLALLETKGFVSTTTQYSDECSTPFYPPTLSTKVYERR